MERSWKLIRARCGVNLENSQRINSVSIYWDPASSFKSSLRIFSVKPTKGTPLILAHWYGPDSLMTWSFPGNVYFRILWHLKWSMYLITTAPPKDNVQCRINSLSQGQRKENVKKLGKKWRLKCAFDPISDRYEAWASALCFLGRRLNFSMSVHFCKVKSLIYHSVAICSHFWVFTWTQFDSIPKNQNWRWYSTMQMTQVDLE